MSKPHSRAVVWFRRDLRLTDNPALLHAVEHADCIIPLYIHAPEDEGRWPAGAASRWWLHESLRALAHSLGAHGARLVLRRGPTLEALQQVIADTGATLLVWNRLYEPAALALEERVRAALEDASVAVDSFNGSLLYEPDARRNQQQRPYRVFGAFWRAAERDLPLLPPPAVAPHEIPGIDVQSASLDDFRLLPAIHWYDGMAEAWTPGEVGALERLAEFEQEVAQYGTGRDRPDEALTSRLSPHLHFGELSPLQVLASIRNSSGGAGAEIFVRELGWREFAHHLLFHFPHTVEKPLDARFEQLSWSHDSAALEAWRRGCTGVPIVDAGLRQLWRTGWMHNRVRMIVASYLTKNLQTHWLEGARWFWDTLVDADLANNTMNWQWVAGCGADAAPYYRIFNPVLQAERFDPQRAYIRRWIPELAALPDNWIHQPWAAPKDALDKAGVRLGETYPHPIVDLAASRKAALAMFEGLKSV